MNCSVHPEVAASGFCRECGAALCADCRQEWRGIVHCANCMAKFREIEDSGRPGDAPPEDAPRSAGPPPDGAADQAPSRAAVVEAPSRVLALLLGLIPGVGAVYNGQYAKAVVHVVIFGGLVALLAGGGLRALTPLLAMFTALVYFYMPIEAFRTASALQRGEQVDEFSGLAGFARQAARGPVAGVVLIVVGVLFLLESLGYWRIRSLAPYWPVLLIVFGVYLLYQTITDNARRNEGTMSRGFRQTPPPSPLPAPDTTTAATTAALPGPASGPASESEKTGRDASITAPGAG